MRLHSVMFNEFSRQTKRDCRGKTFFSHKILNNNTYIYIYGRKRKVYFKKSIKMNHPIVYLFAQLYNTFKDCIVS